jgi:hypothetical protein
MTTPKKLGTSIQKPENLKYNLNLNLMKSKNLPTLVSTTNASWRTKNLL